MGQCSSTLPEARAQSSARNNNDNSTSNHSSRQRLRDEGRMDSLDFNKLIATPNGTKMKSSDQSQRKGALQVTVPPNNGGGGGDPDGANESNQQPQARDPDQSRMPSSNNRGAAPEPMDVDRREGSSVVPTPPLPPPPESSVRTRCYKLNLDSEICGITMKQPNHQICLGPFAEPPPHLTYSNSEDSSTTASATNVAIQTAQIFRGLTVAKDGTILSQNARATRSSKGSKAKKGERSRQAAKIDKAKDLVEEVGKDSDSKEPTNMVSLVIIGAYDDMKQLVRDGSKKLREADGLSDEDLFAINRNRVSSTATSPIASSIPSPRKQRSSTHGHTSSSQRTNTSMQTPEKSSRTSGSSGLPQSAPPKLKSNPRDRTKPRRHSEEKSRRAGFVTDSCNDMLDNSQHANIDGDWRDALGFSKGFHSIWNCGGADEGGTVSPTQICSPKEGNKPRAMEVTPSPQHRHQPVFEGRDSAPQSHGREGEVTSRAN